MMKNKLLYKYQNSNFLIISFLLFFLGFVSASFSQSKNLNLAHDKVYVHFDKPNYYVGEDIWFKTYLVNAVTHSSETLSKVVYVELINPSNEIIETKTIKINEGGGEGDFKLVTDLVSGEYTVRAYTNFMRNFDHSYFFKKQIYIKNLRLESITDKAVALKSEDVVKPDIQFFPEGGYLVSGFLNRVGFKALGIDGNGIDIEGIIVDNAGGNILQIKTSNFGLGKFAFIPEKNKIYNAVFNYKGKKITYQLPIVLDKGIVMRVLDRDNYYKVYLQTSLDKGFNNFNLIGSQRTGIIFKTKISGNKAKALINVPKNILEQGIVQFTLIDNNNEPLRERLSFYESNKSNVKINIKPSKQEYGKRELVELEISLDTIVHQKLQTNLSIAVTDISAVKLEPFGLDIKSQLLLNSELKGNIEKPGYYFNSNDPNRKSNLDLLMMTQGWRQFIINDTLNSQSKPIYTAETGISLSGSIKNLYNHKKSAIAEVSLSYRNKKGFTQEVIMTNKKGQFAFKNLNFLDSTYIIIQAQKIKKEKHSKKVKAPNMNFYIEMDTFIAPNISLTLKTDAMKSSKEMIKISPEKTEYLESLDKFQKGTVKLNEVVLETHVSDRNTMYNKKRLLYKDASQTIDFKNLSVLPTDNALSALYGRVPGYSKSGVLRAASTMLGSNQPLYLLDGMPVDSLAIISILITEIDFVDILKGPRAAIYGSRAANGVIAVYTLNGTERLNTNTKRRGIVNFVHPGYSHARKFYEPIYKIQKKENDKFDYRSTLYWNPTIKLDENGKTRIFFYTSDVISPYQVILEGITLNGQIIKTEILLNK